jgi:tetratricopeptide (TPR) repeat protein
MILGSAFPGLCLAAMAASGLVCLGQTEVWPEAFHKADQLIATKDYAGSRDVLAAALRTSPPSDTNGSDVAFALLRIGSLDLDMGAFREAEKAYLRAIPLWDKPNPPEMDRSLAYMGLQIVYMRTGQLTKAERFSRQVLQMRQDALGPDNVELGGPIQNLAAVYQLQHRYPDARDLFRRAIQLFERAGAKQSRGLAAARGNLAMLLAESGDFDAAIQEAKTAVLIWQTVDELYAPQLAIALTVLADTECRARRWIEAQEPILKAQEITVRLFGNRHPMLAPILRTYADVLEHSGRKREAKEMIRNAEEIARESSQANLTGYTVDADAYRAAGRVQAR